MLSAASGTTPSVARPIPVAAALDQHLEGFAHTRRRAEEDLEPSASLFLREGEQGFRVGAAGVVAARAGAAGCLAEQRSSHGRSRGEPLRAPGVA